MKNLYPQLEYNVILDNIKQLRNRSETKYFSAKELDILLYTFKYVKIDDSINDIQNIKKFSYDSHFQDSQSPEKSQKTSVIEIQKKQSQEITNIQQQQMEQNQNNNQSTIENQNQQNIDINENNIEKKNEIQNDIEENQENKSKNIENNEGNQDNNEENQENNEKDEQTQQDIEEQQKNFELQQQIIQEKIQQQQLEIQEIKKEFKISCLNFIQFQYPDLQDQIHVLKRFFQFFMEMKQNQLKLQIFGEIWEDYKKENFYCDSKEKNLKNLSIFIQCFNELKIEKSSLKLIFPNVETLEKKIIQDNLLKISNDNINVGNIYFLIITMQFDKLSENTKQLINQYLYNYLSDSKGYIYDFNILRIFIYSAQQSGSQNLFLYFLWQIKQKFEFIDLKVKLYILEIFIEHLKKNVKKYSSSNSRKIVNINNNSKQYVSPFFLQMYSFLCFYLTGLITNLKILNKEATLMVYFQSFSKNNDNKIKIVPEMYENMVQDSQVVFRGDKSGGNYQNNVENSFIQNEKSKKMQFELVKVFLQLLEIVQDQKMLNEILQMSLFTNISDDELSHLFMGFEDIFVKLFLNINNISQLFFSLNQILNLATHGDYYYGVEFDFILGGTDMYQEDLEQIIKKYEECAQNGVKIKNPYFFQLFLYLFFKTVVQQDSGSKINDNGKFLIKKFYLSLKNDLLYSQIQNSLQFNYGKIIFYLMEILRCENNIDFRQRVLKSIARALDTNFTVKQLKLCLESLQQNSNKNSDEQDLLIQEEDKIMFDNYSMKLAQIEENLESFNGPDRDEKKEQQGQYQKKQQIIIDQKQIYVQQIIDFLQICNQLVKNKSMQNSFFYFKGDVSGIVMDVDTSIPFLSSKKNGFHIIVDVEIEFSDDGSDRMKLSSSKNRLSCVTKDDFDENCYKHVNIQYNIISLVTENKHQLQFGLRKRVKSNQEIDCQFIIQNVTNNSKSKKFIIFPFPYKPSKSNFIQIKCQDGKFYFNVDNQDIAFIKEQGSFKEELSNFENIKQISVGCGLLFEQSVGGFEKIPEFDKYKCFQGKINLMYLTKHALENVYQYYKFGNYNNMDFHKILPKVKYTKDNMFAFLNLKCTQLSQKNYLQAFGKNNQVQTKEFIYDENYNENDKNTVHLSEAPLKIIQKQEVAKKNFFEKILQKKDKIQQVSPKIYASNITFIQQNSFKDLLLSVGNVEIFFYIIDMLIQQFNELRQIKKDDQNLICEPIQGILNIVIQLLQSDKDDEIKEFLEPADNVQQNSNKSSSGIMILVHLLTSYMELYGCSQKLLDTVFSFVEKCYSIYGQIDKGSDKYDSIFFEYVFQCFILDFTLWKNQNTHIQIIVIEYIQNMLFRSKDLVRKIRDQSKLYYIFDILNSYFNDQDISKNPEGQFGRIKLIEIVKFIMQSDLSQAQEIQITTEQKISQKNKQDQHQNLQAQLNKQKILEESNQKIFDTEIEMLFNFISLQDFKKQLKMKCDMLEIINNILETQKQKIINYNITKKLIDFKQTIFSLFKTAIKEMQDIRFMEYVNVDQKDIDYYLKLLLNIILNYDQGTIEKKNTDNKQKLQEVGFIDFSQETLKKNSAKDKTFLSNIEFIDSQLPYQSLPLCFECINTFVLKMNKNYNNCEIQILKILINRIQYLDTQEQNKLLNVIGRVYALIKKLQTSEDQKKFKTDLIVIKKFFLVFKVTNDEELEQERDPKDKQNIKILIQELMLLALQADTQGTQKFLLIYFQNPNLCIKNMFDVIQKIANKESFSRLPTQMKQKFMRNLITLLFHLEYFIKQEQIQINHDFIFIIKKIYTFFTECCSPNLDLQYYPTPFISPQNLEEINLNFDEHWRQFQFRADTKNGFIHCAPNGGVLRCFLSILKTCLIKGDDISIQENVLDLLIVIQNKMNRPKKSTIQSNGLHYYPQNDQDAEVWNKISQLVSVNITFNNNSSQFKEKNHSNVSSTDERLSYRNSYNVSSSKKNSSVCDPTQVKLFVNQFNVFIFTFLLKFLLKQSHDSQSKLIKKVVEFANQVFKDIDNLYIYMENSNKKLGSDNQILNSPQKKVKGLQLNKQLSTNSLYDNQSFKEQYKEILEFVIQMEFQQISSDFKNTIQQNLENYQSLLDFFDQQKNLSNYQFFRKLQKCQKQISFYKKIMGIQIQIYKNSVMDYQLRNSIQMDSKQGSITFINPNNNNSESPVNSLTGKQLSSTEGIKDQDLIKYMKEFQKFKNEREQRKKNQRNNELKIQNQWRFLRKKLTNDRGLWYNSQESVNEVKLFKFCKIETSDRRRVHLKADKKWIQKEYKIRKVSYDSQPNNAQISPQRPRKFSEAKKTPKSLRISQTNDEIQGFSKKEMLEVKDELISNLRKDKNQEKELCCLEAEYISQKGSIYGTFTIKSKSTIFQTIDKKRPKERKYMWGSTQLRDIKKKKQWDNLEIKEVQSRRYNLKEIAIEFKTDEDKYYFITFYSNQDQQKALKCFKENEYIKVVIDRKKEFEQLKLKEQWLEGQITNFEYLMAINTYSGRSFNDLSQYFIFPWILNNYTADSIEIKQNKNYRDLTKPIGRHQDSRFNSEFKPRFEDSKIEYTRILREYEEEEVVVSELKKKMKKLLLKKQKIYKNQLRLQKNQVNNTIQQEESELGVSSQLTQKDEFSLNSLENGGNNQSQNIQNQITLIQEKQIMDKQIIDKQALIKLLQNDEEYLELNKKLAPQVENLQMIYDQLNIYRDQNCLYRTHYSSSPIVYGFLIRLEPFSTLHHEFQGGKFDVADRLFHNIKSQWSTCQNNTGDVRELIPEFYYMPDFLKNKNSLDLGKQQCGDSVDDVNLPPWVKTQTAEEFIFILKRALESKYVNKYLNKWIDLIFGVKAGCDEKAEESDNLFRYLSYQENIGLLDKQDALDEYLVGDIELSSLITQLQWWGQTPYRLFDKEHESKKIDIQDDEKYSQILEPFKPQRYTIFMNKKNESVEKIFYCQQRGISSLIKCKDIFHIYQYPLKTKLSQTVDFSKSQGKESSIEIGSLVKNINHQHVVARFNQFFFIGGFPDNSFKMCDIDNKRKIETNCFHKEIVTCLDVSKQMLVVGSRDCRISIWKIILPTVSGDQENYQQQQIILPTPVILHGHHNEVVIVKINTKLNIIISVDLDGVVIIHSANSKRYLRNFQLNIQEENILNLQIHEMGFLVIVTTYKIFIYTINGDKYLELKQSELIENDTIRDLQFLSEFHSEFFATTNKRQLIKMDIFELKQIEQKKIIVQKNDQRFKNKFDQLQSNELQKLNDKNKINNNEYINSIFLQNDNKQKEKNIICGFQNGKIVIIQENAAKQLQKLKKDFKELGM